MIEQQEQAVLNGEDQIIAGVKYVWQTVKATILQTFKYV